MPQLTPEEFEALWQKAQNAPAAQVAPTRTIELDVSLSTMLDRYAKMADSSLSQQKISKIQHDALVAAIAALKAALAAINEKDLLAQHLADSAKNLQQQAQQRIASAAARKP
jgi:hypothetical protein